MADIKCIERIVTTPYSAEQMFDLVNDVDHYPDFLPWCGGVQIYKRSHDAMHVRVNIKFKALQPYFETYNTLTRPTQINMKLMKGPFEHFSGAWQFNSIEDGSQIIFKLQYCFSNSLLGMIIGPFFDHIISTFVDSFIKQANLRYGSQ